jgi:hypothetical protein
MDEQIRSGVRADVGIMLDSLRRGQHEQYQRDRMMQEVAQRHFDAAAVDRQMMMGMVNHLTQALHAHQNRDEPMPQSNDVNLTYMQEMHQQTMHMVQNNREVLSQFLN